MKEEQDSEAILTDEVVEDDMSQSSHALPDDIPEEPLEEAPPPPPAPRQIRRLPAQQAAVKELYMHEIFALMSCFLFPILGAYLLHTIRSQLSRPSEGLVSNYNLTIFLLASEVRPMSHLVKLIQARTLHLQRIVNANPYDGSSGKESMTAATQADIIRRLDGLEARASTTVEATAESAAAESSSNKQSSNLTMEVRRSIQPDLDALNRAVRRYEKRAMLQTYQTESRLFELESRINDAISLAAAAANGRHNSRSYVSVILDGVSTAVVLPFRAFAALFSLPFKAMSTLINFGNKKTGGPSVPERSRKAVNGKYPATSRVAGDRLQSRVLKK